MPRGGRRPGAGAPRGNYNAFRTGNNSRRRREAWAALQRLMLAGDAPALRAVLAAIRDAVRRCPRRTMLANLPAVIDLIHTMLVDCSRPGSIKRNQTQSNVAPQIATAGAAANLRRTPANHPAAPISPAPKEPTTIKAARARRRRIAWNVPVDARLPGVRIGL